MTHVLSMAAREVGNPMPLRVLRKTDHRARYRGHERSMTPPALGVEPSVANGEDGTQTTGHDASRVRRWCREGEGNSWHAPVFGRFVKGRIAFYGSVLLALILLVAYATAMPGTSYRGAPGEASPDEKALALGLRAHVDAMSERIGERHLGRADSLASARDYILTTVRAVPGLKADQIHVEDVGPAGKHAENIVVELRGAGAEVVVVGAHYDSAEGAAGADDNASGVAAALELLRRASTHRFERTCRFVLFANEEPPYFQTAGMGSLAHARASRQRGEHVSAMLSLESLGYYSDAEGSQRYPWPVGLLYPDRGDFVAFVGNLGSRSLVRDTIGAFRSTATVPSEGAALPAGIPGVGWSDHWAFWENGAAAVMVTDTAPFRNPNYHRASDRAATLDYLKLARVTLGLGRVVEELAGAI